VHGGESPADSAQLVRTPLERLGAPVIDTDAKPHVLIPFDLDEALTVAQAAQIAGRRPVTVREWAANYDIGRRVGGRWMVSRVALAMHLDNDRNALKAYLMGDRESETVTGYFRRFGLDPRKI
jgi:Helix-turn-helix domain